MPSSHSNGPEFVLTAAVLAAVVGGLAYGTQTSRIRGDRLAKRRTLLFWLSVSVLALGLGAWLLALGRSDSAQGGSLVLSLLAGLAAAAECLLLLVVVCELGGPRAQRSNSRLIRWARRYPLRVWDDRWLLAVVCLVTSSRLWWLAHLASRAGRVAWIDCFTGPDTSYPMFVSLSPAQAYVAALVFAAGAAVLVLSSVREIRRAGRRQLGGVTNQDSDA